MSLRDSQTQSLKEMLKMNTDVNKQTDQVFMSLEKQSEIVPSWKILVFDSAAQDILSPTMNIKALREEGVTLHLSLHSRREEVPDVPAIYFCAPSEDNIRRIAKDFQEQLYGSYYFHFILPIPRKRLEDLAQGALNASAASNVKRVYDQFVNFICLENEMFCLSHHDANSMSFTSLHQKSTTDQNMDDIINLICEGLYSICITLAIVPIIRCSCSHAAEMVAIKLEKKLRDALKESRSLDSKGPFTNSAMHSSPSSFGSVSRPVLIILDRHFDIATCLHHTWSYQTLTHDVLNYKLNRVSFVEPQEKENVPPKSHTHDLDSIGDQIWRENKSLNFPQVAEKIQDELDDYRSSETEIKKMKEEMGVGASSSGPGLTNGTDTGVDFLTDNTHKLTSAVHSLPVLLEKKRLIDMHMSIATALLDQIKLRKLDQFFDLEEKLMAKGVKLIPYASPDHTTASNVQPSDPLIQQLIELLKNPEVGTATDKMRIFLIYYMCCVAPAGGGQSDATTGSSSSSTVSGGGMTKSASYAGVGAVGGGRNDSTSTRVSEECNTDLIKMVNILEKEMNYDMSAFYHVKKIVSINRMVSDEIARKQQRQKALMMNQLDANRKGTGSGTSGVISSGSYFGDYSGAGTRTIGMFSKLVSQGSSFVMEGVKNLVVKRHHVPITQVVQEIMEQKSGQFNDNFRYIDPKVVQKSGGGGGILVSDSAKHKQTFDNAIVFVVGGGNYLEYENLMEYVRQFEPELDTLASLRSPSSSHHASSSSSSPFGGGMRKSVIYGCTSVVNGEQMLSQLAQLGKE